VGRLLQCQGLCLRSFCHHQSCSWLDNQWPPKEVLSPISRSKPLLKQSFSFLVSVALALPVEIALCNIGAKTEGCHWAACCLCSVCSALGLYFVLFIVWFRVGMGQVIPYLSSVSPTLHYSSLTRNMQSLGIARCGADPRHRTGGISYSGHTAVLDAIDMGFVQDHVRCSVDLRHHRRNSWFCTSGLQASPWSNPEFLRTNNIFAGIVVIGLLGISVASSKRHQHSFH